jgi:hypothetical protein
MVNSLNNNPKNLKALRVAFTRSSRRALQQPFLVLQQQFIIILLLTTQLNGFERYPHKAS